MRFLTQNTELQKPTVFLQLKVTPKSSRTEILPIEPDSDYLHIKVKALPEDGEANKAVIALLAKTLGVPKQNVQLVSGHKSRIKKFQIEAHPAHVIKALGPLKIVSH